jgi:hypothetical protein
MRHNKEHIHRTARKAGVQLFVEYNLFGALRLMVLGILLLQHNITLA